MKYSELISFNPIESTIQLVESNKSKEASANLVDSYVVSDTMVENLKVNIIEHLQMDEVIDNKGVLVVGNYGTGKSHLMSVIAAVATDVDNVQYIHNDKLANAVKPIAGKFEVLRIEIGGVTMSLREIIMSYIQDDFAEKGLDLELPDFNTVRDNKQIIKDVMALFETKYPDKGYLVVVDEFLSYLSSRNTRDIVLDLDFLRALGEMSSKSKIRVIFGVQEKIFDNPRFSFVSDSLRHVSDRFTQCIITKEATSYVVSERILKKIPEQKALIREHLEKFSELYTGMSSKMDDFVDLFPIHPSYIDVFNKLYLIETRHILKNISVTIRNIFDQDVPEDAPGIISFDNYWSAIKTNATLKTEPTVSKVIAASAQLEDIVSRSFPKAPYKPMAKQIIYALSVYKLGTGLDSQAGLTAENLKDDLCLYRQLPEKNPEFLLGIVSTTLKDIMTTVSGQFISFNEDNNQYFIDVDKTVDYDEKIKQRAMSLSNDELNRAFYKSIYNCLEWDARQYVNGFEIYEYDINWDSHNMYREGYLFLGIPRERSTAQPERDFYIHIMPPYGEMTGGAQNVDDEVYLYFKSNDEFKELLSLYAGAVNQAQVSDGKDKDTYNIKANTYRKKINRYLSDNKNTCFDVEYKTDKKQIIEVLKGKYDPDATFKDVIDLVASICLDEYFNDKYPEFPALKTKITKENRISTIKAAYDHFAGRTTKQSVAVLESFGLLDNGRIAPEKSKYAAYYIDMVKKLSPQGVLNFTDIFDVNERDEKLDKRFGLSNELLAIVLLALVYAGYAVITIKNDQKITAASLDTVPGTSTIFIYDFKHISKPADMPIAELKRMFEVLGLNPNLLNNASDRQTGLEQMGSKAQELSNLAAISEQTLKNNFTLWGEALVSDAQMQILRNACIKVGNEFNNYSAKYNTVAKLNNFGHSIDEIDGIEKQIKRLNSITEYKEFATECTTIVSYISGVEMLEIDEMAGSISAAKEEFRKIRDSIYDGNNGNIAANTVKKNLESIKSDYIELYLSEHNKRRLTISEDKQKKGILESKEVLALKKLKSIETLPTRQLNDIEDELAHLKTCYELTKAELENNYYCPHCKFSLGSDDLSKAGRLNNIETRIDKALEDWTDTLLDTISDPIVLAQKEFLDSKQKAIIDDFTSTKKLPEIVDEAFVSAIKALLAGFEPVVIDTDDFISELEKLPPMDENAFKNKLDAIIKSYVSGKDANKVRIQVKRKN